MPPRTALFIRGVSTEVRANGVSGPGDVQTVSGDVTIDHAQLAHVRTVSGDVSVRGAASGAIEIDTTSGDVRWGGHCELRCSVRVKSISGDVSVSPDEASRYALRFESVSGEQSGAAAPGGPGAIFVKTVSGDLSVER